MNVKVAISAILGECTEREHEYCEALRLRNRVEGTHCVPDGPHGSFEVASLTLVWVSENPLIEFLATLSM